MNTQYPSHFIEDSWKPFFKKEESEPYFSKLLSWVETERQNGMVFPPPAHVFQAFNLCPLDIVKVIIIGQDPYHGDGQAEGLAFSVPKGVRPPPSLKNIYKELLFDLGLPISSNGSLESWARQGVLLLNTTLTVAKGLPMSHVGQGWETFTSHAIRFLSRLDQPLVFVLWGNHAKNYYEKAKALPQNRDHLVLVSAHPSPFSAKKFLGTKPFSKINNHLISHNIGPIDFSISA